MILLITVHYCCRLKIIILEKNSHFRVRRLPARQHKIGNISTALKISDDCNPQPKREAKRKYFRNCEAKPGT
jgi:hypothetical protein